MPKFTQWYCLCPGLMNMGRPVIITNNKDIIININFNEDESSAEAWDIASLIAAAPEMYEALNRLVIATKNTLKGSEQWEAHWQAQQALTKAEGRNVK